MQTIRFMNFTKIISLTKGRFSHKHLCQKHSERKLKKCLERERERDVSVKTRF